MTVREEFPGFVDDQDEDQYRKSSESKKRLKIKGKWGSDMKMPFRYINQFSTITSTNNIIRQIAKPR